MAQSFGEFIELFVLGEFVVFQDPGLPAVEAAQTPGGGDFLDIVLFEKGAWGKLRHPFGFKLALAFGVFAECGEDDIACKQAVRGGIPAGNCFAGVSIGQLLNSFRSSLFRCLPVPITAFLLLLH